jgi:hypothetical protein
MGFQSPRNPNFENFETPNLVIWGQDDIWVFAPWLGTKKYYKGEGGGFPEVRVVMSLVSPCLPMARSCTKNVPTMH